MAVDGSGNVYIADTGDNAIKEWNAATQTLSTLVSSGLNVPSRRGGGRRGQRLHRRYGNDAIKEWNAATQTVSTLVSSGLNTRTAWRWTLGQRLHRRLPATTRSRSGTPPRRRSAPGLRRALNNPSGVAVDASGNVYIADSGNNAIKEWNAATQTLSTLVSSGLNTPRAVAVDGSGNVYIADSGDNRRSRSCRGPSSRPSGQRRGGGGQRCTCPWCPASESLTGVFAPTSDQSWLTIGSVSGGVVKFSVHGEPGARSRTAHITLLGQRSR